MKLPSKSFAFLTYLVVIALQNVTAQEQGRHYRIVKNVKITEKPIPDMLKLNRMTEQRFACKYLMFLDLCTCDYLSLSCSFANIKLHGMLVKMQCGRMEPRKS